MTEVPAKNPFKVGRWYGMEDDGYSFRASPDMGVYLLDQEAVEWMFKEKLRRMEKGNG
jgi:hypothetical protein